MKETRGSGLAWWSAHTILISAFLLFQVQPVISKTILPWFGGSPAVWTTCMLFFQVLLLGGYAYAHVVTRYFSPKVQGRLHAALLAISVVTLPIVPGDFWKPEDGNYPALRILLLLACKVGAPYFLLSSTGPLVQAWFSLAYPARSPYRLYALSNIGSLGALLSYPFLFEPAFAVNLQGWLWSLGFVLFAFLAGGLGIAIWRLAASLDPAETPPPSDLPTSEKEPLDAVLMSSPPSWPLRIGWMTLAALASMVLLAITNYLCADIAVVPFMWVVPLSLYLLSFIICFDREIWYSRWLFGGLGIVLVALLCAMDRASDVDGFMIWVQGLVGLTRNEAGKGPFPITFSETFNSLMSLADWMVKRLADFWNGRFPNRQVVWGIAFDVTDFDDSIFAQAIMYLSVLFCACMLCHGELVKAKPAPKYLTMYYLMISAGGATGGIFVGLICPLIFKKQYELQIGIVGTFIVAWVAIANALRYSWLARKEMLQWSAAFAAVGLIVLVLAAQVKSPDDRVGVEVVTQDRNFYGTIVVKDWLGSEDGTPYTHPWRSLYHGRILHGVQYLGKDRQDEATTYYDNEAGSGMAVHYFPRVNDEGIRVAVVGLGTGTMAAHARKGDYYCFYDIDPKVVKLHEEHVFTFLDRARERGAKVDITLGDARISMEREAKTEPRQYDVIVLDAFSGDAIPAHLLTVESLQIYEQQMRKDAQGNNIGILAVHISNKYLNLRPVVAALARKYHYVQVPIQNPEGPDSGDTSSDWVLLTRNEEFLGQLVIQAALIAEADEPPQKEVLWTDQYSNLFDILR